MINVTLDNYEKGIIVNALNNFRNKLLRENEDTEAIDELLLKILNAPDKKKLFKALVKDERG